MSAAVALIRHVLRNHTQLELDRDDGEQCETARRLPFGLSRWPQSGALSQEVERVMLRIPVPLARMT